jgi:hypothetical protein
MLLNERRNLTWNTTQSLVGKPSRHCLGYQSHSRIASKFVDTIHPLGWVVTFGQDPLSLYELSWIIETIAGVTEYDVRREVEELCARYMEQYKHTPSPYLTCCSIFTFSTSYVGMIDEVRVGTKQEALWLFGQILGSETLDEELQYNEAGPSSRCEALFAKGTVLQLRHSSLGENR